MAIVTRRELGTSTEELVVPGRLTATNEFRLTTLDTTAATVGSTSPARLFQVQDKDGGLFVVPAYTAT